MACEGADEPRVLQKHCLLGLTPRHASIMGEPIEDSFRSFARLVLPPIFQVMADKPLQQLITRRLLGSHKSGIGHHSFWHLGDIPFCFRLCVETRLMTIRRRGAFHLTDSNRSRKRFLISQTQTSSQSTSQSLFSCQDSGS